MGCISDFMELNFRHFNARETLDAAKAWRALLNRGGAMFLTMAGAMSTAEIGVSLARMIRQDKVAAICCTAANLEEDLFNLFNHDEYRMVPNYRDLSPADEKALYDEGLNRVTDTCIPEGVFRQVQARMSALWLEAAESGQPRFPWEFIYALLDQPGVEELFRIPREDSWVLAAKEKGLPIYTPGWEDCTLGNIFVSEVMRGKLPHHGAIRRGTEQLEHLAGWYMQKAAEKTPVGFFQIGGGIAGDFPICVVPMLIQDMERDDTPFWAYFAQISDSTTSYGSYSGAVPNEKITWGKLDANTPRFMINSDASIVAPLVFSYVLGE
ncbi:MAG: deoxyhypusine synthase family protein [Humidesulfovibrio sp.]|uniref:deoxyhypusine synthase family protein n=1 Tax=Humidesulfovibrio sp. TaxID=2910988 RepID=UPI0027350A6C|nr:deoxyhypusine synthase family protein [Humidesulfovibrio sp.]MDP2846822.1 deoxyhypusine synthase family protein [Humidesulfovibrio sp.]